ncbi:MAG: MFS transporter, partial [Chloroflexota bacterium]|nr:MFS transporter [Chloroflexota bacterium]
ARPLLLGLIAVSVVSGASGEGLDRLGEAHFLRNFAFPSIGDFRPEPVVWFGIINLGASLLGLAAAEAVARRVDTSDGFQAARALLVLESLRIGGILVFGLAGGFALALASYWVVGAVSAVARPIRGAWLNRNIDPSVRATVLSIDSQANSLGQLAGGPAIGAFGTAYGLRAAMVAAGLVLSPALWLYGRCLKPEGTEPSVPQAVRSTQPE